MNSTTPNLKQLRQASHYNNQPIYRNTKGRFVVLLISGAAHGHSGERSGDYKEFDSAAEARAYLQGAEDAMNATDFYLEAVKKQDWFEGSEVDEDAGAE